MRMSDWSSDVCSSDLRRWRESDGERRRHAAVVAGENELIGARSRIGRSRHLNDDAIIAAQPVGQAEARGARIAVAGREEAEVVDAAQLDPPATVEPFEIEIGRAAGRERGGPSGEYS